MNVRELIELLKLQDQDAPVAVRYSYTVFQEEDDGYMEPYPEFGEDEVQDVSTDGEYVYVRAESDFY